MSEIVLPYEPQQKQQLLHQARAGQIFYGGAAGGGKSHSLRWDAVGFCLQYPGVEAYLFRRTSGELYDNHVKKIQQEIPRELGEYNTRLGEFRFTNGSRISMCYCEKEKDVTRYQGSEMHWLGIDEASHLTGGQLNYLRTRLRLGEAAERLPDTAKELLPRLVLTSNPGGPGHSWLKRTFIDPAPPMRYFYDKSSKDHTDPNHKGNVSIFIPARMADNRFLDSNYAGQFNGLPPEQARALVEGDWDAVVGAALHNLSRDRHMIREFVPPRHWTRFMVIDWGTAKPFSVGWYGVSDGALLKGLKDIWIPAGALVRYREWYGWDGDPDKGCRLPARAVAKKILEKEDDVMDYRVGDAAMWSQHDGPSVSEHFSVEGVHLRPSKKDRIAGYWEVLSRLAGNEHFREDGDEDRPMLFVTENCKHFWRTVPTLVSDSTDPEKGPDTKLEDHVYDELAYACMSRPFVSTEKDRWETENWEAMKAARQEMVDPYATR